MAELLTEASAVEVSVYRSKSGEVERLPIEHYVVGVVASEMPAEFEIEALKAQSLAARTYIVKQLLSDQEFGLVNGADISDTVSQQVYKNEQELKDLWGPDFQQKMEKIRKAVYETRGQIIVFENQPITAAYFSTSNGYTENAEDYWSNAFPYLKSVESPWDVDSPKFNGEKVIAVTDFEKQLGVKISGSQIGEIVEWTKGHRVAKVRIGGKEFSGREIREKLGLQSTDFTWEKKGTDIVIRTKGYGHGVGMSQYGANGMAKEGKTYEDIIRHYYQGAEITDSKPYLEKMVARNE
jgi:stage II sporulation protein D